MYSEEELPLHKAVSENNVERVRDLLNDLPKLACSVDDLGRTALHLSCKYNSTDIAEVILQYVSNINSQDMCGKTCLHLSGSAEFVELFCKHGANPNIADDQGVTPLHLFVMLEKLECVRILLAHKADPTTVDPIRQRSALHVAASMGNLDILTALLDGSCVDINLECPDIDGNTLIHIVAANNNECGNQQKMLMTLLNRGASVLTTNHMGISALHFVCANRYLCSNGLAEPIIEILLHMSADPNVQDNQGCTPLIIACAHREWSICQQLLQAGADMNIPCPMNSILLQQGFGSTVDDVVNGSDCTASDLMPRKARSQLFPYICSPQTRIPGESRDRCMDCGSCFINSMPLVGARNNNNNNNSSSNSTMFWKAPGPPPPEANSPKNPFRSKFSMSSPALSSLSSSLSSPSLGHLPSSSSSAASTPQKNAVNSLFSSLFSRNPLASGKHRCRCCNRVVCANCSNQEMAKDDMPEYCLLGSMESTVRVCKVCFVFLSINSKS